MLNFKPLLNAIHLAVEDLFSATAYLLEHADELQIDPRSSSSVDLVPVPSQCSRLTI